MPPHTEAELPLQGNFAPPLTPILGREYEEAAVVHLLCREDVSVTSSTECSGPAHALQCRKRG
jgi:hypothetical protein